MYVKRECHAGAVTDVQYLMDWRTGKKYTRAGRNENTPEAMAKYNRTLSIRELCRIINENFGPNDGHYVLKYPKYQRPTPEQAKKHIEKFIRTLRRYLLKDGVEMKYVKAIGVGERGGLHIHLVLNTRDFEKVQSAWSHGNFHVEPLSLDGDYSRLAKYFVWQEKGKPGGEINIFGKGWTCSRNIVRPKPEKPQKAKADAWREPPTAKKGYVIDVDSVEAGINPYNGIPYLFYRMRKIPPKSIFISNDGQRLRGADAESALWNKNKIEVKGLWYGDGGFSKLQKRKPEKKKQRETVPDG